MWTKIYLIALAVCAVPMAALIYYAWSWLQSVGDPRVTAENYNLWSGYGLTFLVLSSLALLVLANVVLWTTRRAWALWTTLGYFAVFTVLKYFWLERLFHQFRLDRNLIADGFSFSPLLAVILCVLAAAVVFFDQFIVLRLTEKMHPPVAEPTVEGFSGDAAIDESEKLN